jgi:superfamily II DNA/RNA helicase/predicted RNA-binding protein Jag
VNPTPIQLEAIPLALEGKDIYAQARTGSGKTAAFVLPLLQRLLDKQEHDLLNPSTADTGPVHPKVIVLSPTRELAQQTYQVFLATTKGTSLQAVCLIGGESYDIQKSVLAKGPHFLIATPGRMIDLYKQKLISFAQVQAVVFDEADRLFDMGFKDDIRYVLQKIPGERQLLMFSATNNFEVLNLAYQFKSNPVEISVDKETLLVEKINHSLYHVGRGEKVRLLAGLLNQRTDVYAIIFCNTQSETHVLADWLTNLGFKAKAISGRLPQNKRSRLMDEFRSRKLTILVSTDVAARGLDIDDVNLVINYDLPQDASNYVHRIGRTGRAGKAGEAISFCAFEDCEFLGPIEEYLNSKIPIKHIEEGLMLDNVGSRPRPQEREREDMSNDLRDDQNDNDIDENYTPGNSIHEPDPNEKRKKEQDDFMASPNQRPRRANGPQGQGGQNRNGRRPGPGGRDQQSGNGGRPPRRNNNNGPRQDQRPRREDNRRPQEAQSDFQRAPRLPEEFVVESKDFNEAKTQALAHLQLEDETLLRHEVVTEGKKALFGLLGTKESTYRFYVFNNCEIPAREYLAKLLEMMKLDLEFRITPGRQSLAIDLVGSDEENLTANGFELLESLEHILKKHLGKAMMADRNFRVRLSCNGVANTRDTKLEDLARRMRTKVVESKKPVLLNSMSPAERRIIHQFFSDDKEVKTTSIGDGHYKRIEISLS